MTDEFFVRIRGKVHGPFTEDRLRELVRVGKVSRVHQISEDRKTWKSAKDFSQFFDRPIRQEQDEAIEIAIDDSPDPDATEWFYAANNAQNGPVPLDHIRSMVSDGTISRTDLVWTRGMDRWKPAVDVSDLAATFVTIDALAATAAADAKSNDQLDDQLVDSITGARTWLLFIFVVAFAVAAGLSILGIWSAAIGFHTNESSDAAGGLTLLAMSFVVWGGTFLFRRYAVGLESFRKTSTVAALRDASRSLNALWCFIGVLLIVMLAFFAVSTIWAIAVADVVP